MQKPASQPGARVTSPPDRRRGDWGLGTAGGTACFDEAAEFSPQNDRLSFRPPGSSLGPTCERYRRLFRVGIFNDA